MITLAADCLVFQLASGESIPYSADMLSMELMGDTAQVFDSEFVRHAAKAVFHYFRAELGKETVTLGEFAGALEKVLRGFNPSIPSVEPAAEAVEESDLQRLAQESGSGCELIFFPRLRDELRQQLRRTPQVVRFRGLRGCVKQLMGTARWTPRCQSLEDQIVAFLRECLSAEKTPAKLSMVVE